MTPKLKTPRISRVRREVGGDVMEWISLFGNVISEREGYKEQFGIEAVHFYLVEKYHWTLPHVRGLGCEELRFLLREEMFGWRPPFFSGRRI
jgi:hypothetical protein